MTGFHAPLCFTRGEDTNSCSAQPWKGRLTDTQAPWLYSRNESYNANTGCVLDATVLCVKYKGIAFLILCAILDV